MENVGSRAVPDHHPLFRFDRRALERLECCSRLGFGRNSVRSDRPNAMVFISVVNLVEIRETLTSQAKKEDFDLPCHVAAFGAWVTADAGALQSVVFEAYGKEGQIRYPEHVAALGYGAASQLLTGDQDALLRQELAQLRGRAFFAPGRPLRFEVDGI